MVGDVSDPNVASSFTLAVTSHFNGIVHGLVNNVGTNIRRSTLDYTDEVRERERESGSSPLMSGIFERQRQRHRERALVKSQYSICHM